MNEPFITIAVAVADAGMLAYLLRTADGRRALKAFFSRGGFFGPHAVTYWPPRAVAAQFRRKR